MTYGARDDTRSSADGGVGAPPPAGPRGHVRAGFVSAELDAGQTFGGYHIAELVGSGGMGLVYRAEQRILGRTVALKVIRPEIAESGDYRARFLREARFAAAVDHPNVVSVFDAGEQESPAVPGHAMD